jgi:hypothetical protein
LFSKPSLNGLSKPKHSNDFTNDQTQLSDHKLNSSSSNSLENLLSTSFSQIGINNWAGKVTSEYKIEKIGEFEKEQVREFQHSDSESDELLSTDHDESEPNSPTDGDSDLVSALKIKKIIVGEYVEFKNCKRCGALVFKVRRLITV